MACVVVSASGVAPWLILCNPKSPVSIRLDPDDVIRCEFAKGCKEPLSEHLITIRVLGQELLTSGFYYVVNNVILVDA